LAIPGVLVPIRVVAVLEVLTKLVVLSATLSDQSIGKVSFFSDFLNGGLIFSTKLVVWLLVEELGLKFQEDWVSALYSKLGCNVCTIVEFLIPLGISEV
jgi:hypothetical protein